MNDVKFAFRQLLKNPGFTCAAVLCLALGIGATTAIFSIVNAVLLRPLPYSNPEKLVRLYTEFPTFPNGGLRRFPFSVPEYLDLKRDAKSWDAIEGWTFRGVNLAGDQEPTRATASFITGGMLQMLGVNPLYGRLVTPADDEPSAPLTANISYGLWQRIFGGERSIVGREILLDSSKCTVVGVMPPGFRFPPDAIGPDPPEVWVPSQINPARSGGRSNHGFLVLGRLKPGVTLDQGRAELNSYVKFSQETAAANTHSFHTNAHIIVGHGLHDETVRNVKPALRMLMGAVCFVLLIACVNVANLLLARAEARQREIAIRGAMGASLRRLTVQFVTEGLVLSLAGAGLGLLLAQGGLELVKTASEASIPRASEIVLDARVFLFAIAICVATGIVFGLTPILHLAKQNLQGALKSAAASTTGATGTQRFRHALVVSELALALMLLIGTGLMLRAFWKLQQVNGGFEPANLITASIALPRATYPNDPSKMSFWSRFEERLATLPGVESAALASTLPPREATSYSDTEIEGFVPIDGGPVQNVDFYQTVSKDYFKTLGIRLIEGRVFDERDGTGAPDVAVINQTMARTFWGNDSPIGRRLRPGRGTNVWCTIIGVVEDVKNHGLDKPTGTELYLSRGQTYAQGNRIFYVYLAVCSSNNPSTAINTLRRDLRDLDPALPLARIRTMDEVVFAAQSRPRFLTLLLTLFSSVALVLAAVGIYGVISYSVAQRTKEFGVRMALGAQRGDVLGIVLRRGMLLTLIGIVIGLCGAFVLTRFLSALLFDVTPTDPITFVLVSVLLTAIAFLASYIPAHRATNVDPMLALRYE
ncbi:MAG: ABC transporter permease [Verrucomicrobia subdivision 3 bacterium]|nr:ABC transporter permease [Limisphaerales bacterium]